MLDGYKTYIAAAIAVLTAALGYFNGETTLIAAIEAGAIALGLGFLRRSIKVAEG